MANNEVPQEGNGIGKSNSVTVLIENTDEKPLPSENVSEEKPRSSSIAWSTRSSNAQRTAKKFRSLKRRSSVENFGQFGFLVPALALFPQADGTDALTQQFGDLQGAHRELKLASAHIDDALKGRGSYGKARSYFKPKLAQRCFNILDNPWFRRLIIFNSLVHSFLIFLEPPTIQVVSVHPLVYALNLFCILLFIFDLVVHIIFLTWPVFWSRRAEGGWWNGVEFVLVCCYTVDFILLITSGALGKYIPQIFRSLRLALILCKVKNIQHIFNVLMTIGFKLSKLFFIILVFVLLSACIGVHILMDTYQCNGPLGNSSSTTLYHGKPVPCYIEETEKSKLGSFDHAAYGMLRLFVLLSTENFPEVMLPALRADPAYVIYFGSFVFVGVFFLTAILLAIVVDSYWVYSKKHVKKERSRERAELAKAWNLLDPVGQGALSVDDEKFTKLFYLLKPKNSEAENLVLIEMLDANEDGEVDSFEWTTMLSQVLSLEFEDDDDLLLLDETIGHSKWMIRLRESTKFLSESIFFSHVILILIILHCILFACKWRGQNLEIEFVVQVFRSIIVTIFLFEGVTRLIAVGKRILEAHEIMDLFLVVLAFSSNFVWYTNYPGFFWFRDYATTISSLAVFCRLPFNNRQLKQAVSIFFRIAPVMVDLLCLLGIILFLFATVGMELFHAAPVSSEGHMYLPACGLGFKTFWCSCLILFQMVTTSNWHEIMNSVMEATESNWASLYFVAAYILVNMVIMNLFVAIAIEAFNKLGTLEEDQQVRPHIERQPSDPRPSTVDTSVKHQAVHMIHSVASSLFGSVRADQLAERRQSLAVTDTLNFRNGTIKRGSIFKHRRASITEEKTAEEKEDDEVFEKDEAVQGKGDKRERVLKKRMKEKKLAKQKMANAEHKVRVATAFRGNRDTDLELQVGDEVTVLTKKEDWWHGRCKNKVGWFPASHVILRTVKAVPEYGKRKTRRSTVGKKGGESIPSPQVAEDENDNKVPDLVKEKSSPSLNRKENTFFRERTSTSGSQVPGTPPAVRSRMKVKKMGDWRREILGDMTVMNAEELRELNNIMRAELRTPTGMRSKRLGPLRFGGDDDSMRECSISEDYELMEINQGRPSSGISLEPRPYSGRYLGRSGSPRFGQNAVGPLNRLRTESASSGERSPAVKIPNVEFFGSSSPTPPSTYTVRVSSSSANSSRLSPSPRTSPKQEKKPKEKSKKGEMPEWMKNFVETNNLVVAKDVKFDESKGTGRRRSSTTTSGTGTMKTGTKTGSGTGTGTKTSGSGSPRATGNTTLTKSRASPGVAKRNGTSPAGSRSPGGRPVTPGKGSSGKTVPQ